MVENDKIDEHHDPGCKEMKREEPYLKNMLTIENKLKVAAWKHPEIL